MMTSDLAVSVLNINKAYYPDLLSVFPLAHIFMLRASPLHSIVRTAIVSRTAIRNMSASAVPSSPIPSTRLPESFSPEATTITPKLHLFTAATPNGYKPSILLEELHAAYPDNTEIVYDFTQLRFDHTDQKKPEFLKINPNGRIPALVDENVKGGHNVFESASILLWLVERYDKEYKFWFKDPLEKSQALSWIFFAHGGKFSVSWRSGWY